MSKTRVLDSDSLCKTFLAELLAKKLFAAGHKVGQVLALKHSVAQKGQIHNLTEQIIVSFHGPVVPNLGHKRILHIDYNVV